MRFLAAMHTAGRQTVQISVWVADIQQPSGGQTARRVTRRTRTPRNRKNVNKSKGPDKRPGL
jgi:hypothetical protein